MEGSDRERLLVDGAGVPLLEEDSGSVELLDSTRVTYRAIAPDNAAALQRFHHRLSERSVYLRFFGAMPNLSDRKARYFTNVDGIKRFALVALDPEHPEEIIGVVSFDREVDTERAEYAAAVDDGWQGKGLGLALTRRLIEAALKRGTVSLARWCYPRTRGCSTCSGTSNCPRGCATRRARSSSR